MVCDTYTAYVTMLPRMTINMATHTYYVGCGPEDITSDDLYISFKTRTCPDKTDEQLERYASELLDRPELVVVSVHWLNENNML